MLVLQAGLILTGWGSAGGRGYLEENGGPRGWSGEARAHLVGELNQRQDILGHKKNEVK